MPIAATDGKKVEEARSPVTKDKKDDCSTQCLRRTRAPKASGEKVGYDRDTTTVPEEGEVGAKESDRSFSAKIAEERITSLDLLTRTKLDQEKKAIDYASLCSFLDGKLTPELGELWGEGDCWVVEALEKRFVLQKKRSGNEELLEEFRSFLRRKDKKSKKENREKDQDRKKERINEDDRDQTKRNSSEISRKKKGKKMKFQYEEEESEEEEYGGLELKSSEREFGLSPRLLFVEFGDEEGVEDFPRLNVSEVSTTDSEVSE